MHSKRTVPHLAFVPHIVAILLLAEASTYSSFSSKSPFISPQPIWHSVAANNNLPTPESHFGFRPGTDRKLADYHQIVAYFTALASASDRVKLEMIGKTTEGNEMLVAFISSPQNLAKLEELQQIQARLSDPRRLKDSDLLDLFARARCVVQVNCSLHATEVGATQMAPELAYHLATSHTAEVQSILENVLLVLVPCHNPDGQLMVVDWYRKNAGTPYEKAPLPWLYQKYTGHDNNRDWFMFTQNETQITVERLYNVWHPHVTVDMHQMDQNGARLFVPPYLDPVEPNVDPIIVTLLNMLGTYVQSVLTTEGKAGVVSHAIFDAWTPARAYQHYHGGLRFLTEAASVDIATPVTIKASELKPDLGYDARKASWNFPKPWTGGEWKLRDIVDYDFAAAMAILRHASQNREFWIKSLYQVQRNAVDRQVSPAAYLIPRQQRDLQGLHDLLATLRFGQVEIHQVTEEAIHSGIPFHREDFVVMLHQPFGNFAKALLERQSYPQISGEDGQQRRPYDVTAHTLPLFLGVEAFAIDQVPQGILRQVESLELSSSINGNPSPSFFAIDRGNSGSYRAVSFLLSAGVPVWSATSGFLISDRHWPAGTFLIEGRHQSAIKRMLGSTDFLTSPHGNQPIVEVHGLESAPLAERVPLRLPRIGLYKSWVANMDEGWTRWVLEEYGFRYRTVTNTEIRAEDLRKSLDILIFPDQESATIENGHSQDKLPQEFAGGLGEIGVRGLRRFVESGGSLIALDSATELPIRHFWLQMSDVAAKPGSRFSAPGSVLRVIADSSHPLAYGAGREEAIFFSNSRAFEVRQGNAALKYPPGDLLLSGWIEGEEVIAERAALVEVILGNGRVVLFGFRPQFRAQFRSTYKFLFNALLLPPVRLGTQK